MNGIRLRRKVRFTALGWWNGQAQFKRRAHSNDNRNKKSRERALAQRTFARQGRRMKREAAAA